MMQADLQSEKNITQLKSLVFFFFPFQSHTVQSKFVLNVSCVFTPQTVQWDLLSHSRLCVLAQGAEGTYAGPEWDGLFFLFCLSVYAILWLEQPWSSATSQNAHEWLPGSRAELHHWSDKCHVIDWGYTASLGIWSVIILWMWAQRVAEKTNR